MYFFSFSSVSMLRCCMFFSCVFLLLLSSFPCDGVLFVVAVYSFPRNRVRSNTWTRLKIIQYDFIFEYTFFLLVEIKKKHLTRFNINSKIYLCIDWIECYGAEKNQIFESSYAFEWYNTACVCASDRQNTLKCSRNWINNRC